MVFSCLRRPFDGSTGLASVIAVLVVLTVCTNLRLAGAPVGVGEAGLLAVMTCVFLFRRRTLLATGRRFRPVLAFFGAYLGIVLAAGLLSYMHHRLSTAAAHDVFAFVFASFVGFMVLVLASGDRLMAGALVKALPVSALMVTLLAFALLVVDYLNGSTTLSSLFHANQWWWHRFNGWAQDPNQWGFLLMISCMLFLIGFPNWRGLALFGISLWLLMEVRSDAAVAGIVACVMALAGLSLVRIPSRRRLAGAALVVLVLVVGTFKTVGESHPPSLVVRAIGALAGVQPPVEMLDKHSEMSGNPLYTGYGVNKLDVRLAIWKNTINAWKLSPLIGLGPGAYSGNTGPLQNEESHNLFMQVLVNSGLLGLLSAGLFLGWLAWRLWLSPEACIWLAVLMGILVQGLGQYMMRHPLFWVVTALMVVAAREGPTSATGDAALVVKGNQDRS